ncbi:MAG TPA: MFS transporter [Terriglobales bacterium]|nr:MFS transporter [Terriglobales bacterium]
MRTSSPRSGPQLALATLSFAICFAAWGLLSAFSPRLRELLNLSATQTAFLVSVPVLLGALARIPMGMLTDRFGGRAVFSALMLAVAVPVFWVTRAASYHSLLVVAFFLGLAGSSFAIGIPFVSRWHSPERQGSALGIYGIGNIGQSAAVFGGPLLALAVGLHNVFRGMAALLVVWAIAFALLARNPQGAARPKGLKEMLAVLSKRPLAWLLAAFYFLTFGGFVAFAIYLPILLRADFGLGLIDAGFRTAGFVLLATLARPLGGWLSDQIGGARVLSVVFLGIIPFSLLLMWGLMAPFTVGALGCALLLGIGNGAVFKLVPQYFPVETGTVTGLVGALGGLGGFFPPIMLGLFRDYTGKVWPGFVLLAVVSAILYWANKRVFLPRQESLEELLPPELTRTADRMRAGAWATLWTGFLVAAIVVGSRNLENFDPALVAYTFAIIFATWGVVYHYNVWLGKPTTRIYWNRGWQLFRQRGPLRSLGQLLGLAATHIFAQLFIRRRSRLRWWMHQLIFWGCLLAVLITFPLVFGWISLGSTLNDQMTYVAYVFGVPTLHFGARSWIAELAYHGLDIAALLVLGGIFLSLWRRMRDRGAQAVQSFALDFFPIILLFAICVTGLALTASQQWLRGEYYGFLSITHAIVVISALLYLPFGKFFHIFQRPAQLGVKLYHQAGEQHAGACCARCGQRFASRLQIDDLKRALPRLNFNYALPGPAGNWQELCPACKRITLSRAQLRLKEEAHG